LTFLLALVWIASGWWMLVRTSPGIMRVSLGSGTVVVGHTPISGKEGWTAPLQRKPFAFYWIPRYYPGPNAWALRIPIWPFVLLAAAATARAWQLDIRAKRAARRGRCQKCGYDRAGIAPAAVCPECGAPSA
jgi:hypothetical protein